MIPARARANFLAAAVAACAAILFRFPPQEYSFYPRCPFFALTHHYCPGCGATRAVAELLRGNFTAAMHFNAAVTLLLPFALYYFAMAYWTAIREDRFDWPRVPAWTWKLALSSVGLFGVARIFMQKNL